MSWCTARRRWLNATPLHRVATLAAGGIARGAGTAPFPAPPPPRRTVTGSPAGFRIAAPSEVLAGATLVGKARAVLYLLPPARAGSVEPLLATAGPTLRFSHVVRYGPGPKRRSSDRRRR